MLLLSRTQLERLVYVLSGSVNACDSEVSSRAAIDGIEVQKFALLLLRLSLQVRVCARDRSTGGKRLGEEGSSIIGPALAIARYL